MPRGTPRYIMFAMTACDAYPEGVAELKYSEVPVKDKVYIKVYYPDAEGKMSTTPVNVLNQNLNPKTDDYEYYENAELTKWYPGYGLNITTLYAVPYREVKVMLIDSDGSLAFYGDRLGDIDTLSFKIHSSYDLEKKEPGKELTIDELAATVKAGDTVYLSFKF